MKTLPPRIQGRSNCFYKFKQIFSGVIHFRTILLTFAESICGRNRSDLADWRWFGSTWINQSVDFLVSFVLLTTQVKIVLMFVL